MNPESAEGMKNASLIQWVARLSTHLSILTLGFLISAPSLADIYRCVDYEGLVFFIGQPSKKFKECSLLYRDLRTSRPEGDRVASDRSQNDIPHSRDSLIDASTIPGSIMGVIMGVDTPAAIHKRRPDLIPVVCSEDRYRRECLELYFTDEDALEIVSKHRRTGVDYRLAIPPNSGVTVYKYQHPDDGIEMWFYQDKLFMVYMLNRRGAPWLPSSLNIALLKVALSKKYGKRIGTSHRLRDSITNFSLWRMPGSNSVELIESSRVYNDASSAREVQAFYKSFDSSPELQMSAHELGIIIRENKFPRVLSGDSSLRYFHDKLFDEVISISQKANEIQHKIEESRRRANELRSVEKY